MTTPRFEPPLTVPKKMHASHEPYFAILRNYKDSRKKMVDFICGIGGYIDRHDRYAVEFDISAYCDLDRENLLHAYREQFDDFGVTGTSAELALEEQAFLNAYDRIGDRLWQESVEDAWRNFVESEWPASCEWYAPDLTIQYQSRQLGRGGKHFCLTECEGLDLKMSPEDLSIMLMEKGNAFSEGHSCYTIPHRQVVPLFLLCVKLKVELTLKNIQAEVKQQAINILWNSARAEADELREMHKTREALQEPASTIYYTLVNRAAMQPQDMTATEVVKLSEAFKNICKLAGVAYTGE